MWKLTALSTKKYWFDFEDPKKIIHLLTLSFKTKKKTNDINGYQEQEQEWDWDLKMLRSKNVSKTRGQILGCNWDNSFKNFPPCYSHCFYKRILLPPPLSKSDLKLFCNVNNVYGNLKSEISQDYAQKSQLNSTFIWGRICKPFKEPRNRIPAWRVGTTIPYLTYRPARLNRLAKPIHWNGFLGSINVYKYGHCTWQLATLSSYQ